LSSEGLGDTALKMHKDSEETLHLASKNHSQLPERNFRKGIEEACRLP
jgi:hypothetical protein